MVTRLKAKKAQFSQAIYDRLVTRRARAILALRKARNELAEYERTHTSGIPRKRKGEVWV